MTPVTASEESSDRTDTFTYFSDEVIDTLSYRLEKARDRADHIDERFLDRRLDEAYETDNHIRGLIFFERFFLPFGPHLSNMTVPRHLFEQLSCRESRVSEDAAIRTLRRIEQVTRRRLPEASTVMHALAEYAFIGLPNETSIAFDDSRKPQSLLRIWTKDSVTRYVKELGFRCTNYGECRRGAALEDLRDQRKLTKGSVRSHCEALEEPTHWISACDDASWALKYARVKGFLHERSCRVAIISVPKLEKMDILWRRSDDLIRDVGAQPWSKTQTDGIRNNWLGHIMIYGAIPAPCIVKIFTGNEFAEACRSRGFQDTSAVLRPPHELLRIAPSHRRQR